MPDTTPHETGGSNLFVLVEQRDDALAEVERLRDENRWVRAFNRLEAAVTHHKRATANVLGDHEDADTALYKARDKIVGDLGPG